MPGDIISAVPCGVVSEHAVEGKGLGFPVGDIQLSIGIFVDGWLPCDNNSCILIVIREYLGCGAAPGVKLEAEVALPTPSDVLGVRLLLANDHERGSPSARQQLLIP